MTEDKAHQPQDDVAQDQQFAERASSSTEQDSPSWTEKDPNAQAANSAPASEPASAAEVFKEKDSPSWTEKDPNAQAANSTSASEPESAEETAEAEGDSA